MIIRSCLISAVDAKPLNVVVWEILSRRTVAIAAQFPYNSAAPHKFIPGYSTLEDDAASFNLKEPCVLYIGQAHRYPPKTPFYIFLKQIYVQNFLNMLHNLRIFFSSKCRLFHNFTFFGSCIIHILNTGCAKI
jgi:hypothetical protein